MTNLTDTSAFEAFKPLADRIEARITSRIETSFAKWVEESGGVYKHYRYNDTSREAKYFLAVRRYVRGETGSCRTGEKMILASDVLAKEAKQIAEDSVLGFVAKLISKVGDLKMTDLQFRGGADFTIRADANGHDVCIEQQTVYKMTQSWALYCQFPARIYVDGKFTPAAKFKEAVA